MSKVGFIVEDKPYQKLIESKNFKELLSNVSLELVGVYISPDGRDRLFGKNEIIQKFFNILNNQGANNIYVLIDNEDDPCISFTKERIHIYDEKKQINIIVVKAIESWFLADSVTLGKIFGKEDYQFGNPEECEGNPFDKLKEEFISHLGRGISKRRNLHANKLLSNGFSLINAANNPNCPSAKYFINKLSQLNPQ